MKQEILTEALLRQFLLGKVDDEEHVRIESLVLTDSDVRERVLAAEQDLIEDYLEDNLTATDKQLFLERYAQTSEQQRKLRITKSIKDWALRESAASQMVPEKTSGWARLREHLRFKPAFVIPIVVTAMIVIVVATVWWSRRQEQQAIQQELAELNSQASLSEDLPNMSSISLSPGVVRSDQKEDELKKTPQVQTFQLYLPWTQPERYALYQAEVMRVGTDERFKIPNLFGVTDHMHTIRLRLPAHLLRRGHYKLRVSGINADGSVGLTEDYVFAVSE